MKKYFLIVVTISLLISCKSKKSETEIAVDKIQLQNRVDSAIKRGLRDIMIDTIGVGNAPIKILSAIVVKQEYSSYRNVRLTFKNVSEKRIEAARFKWYAETAFGEPADIGILAKGFGAGEMDQPLASGKSRTLTWMSNSSDAKNIKMAWPCEIIFADGSKWVSSK